MNCIKIAQKIFYEYQNSFNEYWTEVKKLHLSYKG
jgi:hypothetical protein